ncbi:MAG: hypothetical protein EOR67_01220 [Mesorhizobium sp.]|uniref:hypothetical protein n=1 Tax=Mesorhizobium sp. TaxID=1871066 RepID=UPI000FE84DC5|nr:hypothetical protein [Mesorhizobium sp.]RWL86426.1 MAG: hypothetical protein EOR69_01220 [Mesorhizobium sp.]RWL91245.1 MAG: hypothetical protein EOR67_01220 [Mesorhizobium sp.]RWM01076.1 MAG: hypothetical protein EOR70_04570 [Mesorhizobium sp.]TIP46017.1 MAG: hypothetical protein E5X77_17735 [Mesorhizobium sp.]
MPSIFPMLVFRAGLISICRSVCANTGTAESLIVKPFAPSAVCALGGQIIPPSLANIGFSPTVNSYLSYKTDFLSSLEINRLTID